MNNLSGPKRGQSKPRLSQAFMPAGEIGSLRHPASALPALLEAAFHLLAAGAPPTLLRYMLKVVQQLAGPRLLLGMVDPNFGQALIRGQLPGHAGEELALHARTDPLDTQRIGPKPASEASSACTPRRARSSSAHSRNSAPAATTHSQSEVGSTGQAQHGDKHTR